MPQLPDYKRPFDQPDFRGYFRWSARLSRAIGGHVYHACHEDELEQIEETQSLELRSEWQLKLPKHGTWPAPGVWVGLNYFHQGNHYGPCLLTLPIEILDGRNFMVFRREGADRNRYFFVQYEARIPIYSFGKKLWRTVKPEHYFEESDGGLSKKADAIYDIVLTNPLPLTKFTVKGVSHPKCISRKCSGTTATESQEIVHRVAVKQARKVLCETPEVQDLLAHFPCLVGTKMPLKLASE